MNLKFSKFNVQKIAEIFNRQSTRGVCPKKVLRTITLSATTLAVLAMPTVISDKPFMVSGYSGNDAFVAYIDQDVIENPKESKTMALTTTASVVTTTVTTTTVTTTTTKATTTEEVEEKTDNNYQEEDSYEYDDSTYDDYDYEYYEETYDYSSEETYSEDTDTSTYSSGGDYDKRLLAEITCHEYGADWVPVEEKAKIVAAVINRVESDNYPDSVYDVLMQDGQFHGSWDGGYGYWPGTVEPNSGSWDAVEYYFDHQDEYSDNYTSWSGDGQYNYFY